MTKSLTFSSDHLEKVKRKMGRNFASKINAIAPHRTKEMIYWAMSGKCKNVDILEEMLTLSKQVIEAAEEKEAKSVALLEEIIKE